jgi:hypothetical protein
MMYSRFAAKSNYRHPVYAISERQTPNANANAKRRTPNAERQTPNAKRQTPNAKRAYSIRSWNSSFQRRSDRVCFIQSSRFPSSVTTGLIITGII